MPNIKQDILARVYEIYLKQGLVEVDPDAGNFHAAVEGTYDGFTGTLTFHFRTDPDETTEFIYDSANPAREIYSFRERVVQAGKFLIQQRNTAHLEDRQLEFLNEVTE